MEKKLLLLGLLRNQEMHGYQLNEFIENSLPTCIEIKKPTAYYILNKMLADKWVTYTEYQEGNRPPRRVYAITPTGEAAFQKLLRKVLSSYQPAKFDDDIGFAFLDNLSTQEAVVLLSKRRANLVTHLQVTQAIPLHPGSFQLMVEHQLLHLNTELNWLNEVIANLKMNQQNNLNSEIN